MRLLLGWVAIERLKRMGVRPIGGDLKARLDDLAGRLRIARPVRLLESALAEVPAVIGWLKPVVLLPARACTGLSAEQIEAILAHELAHIKRCDYVINCFQVMIETLLFYHPAVWWLSRAIRCEREQCCDDVAVSLVGDRFVYARALTAMEALRGRAPGLAMAAGSRGSRLRRRILRLLGVPHEPVPTVARWLAAAVVLVGALTLGVGMPWKVHAADVPPLAALSRDQIPAYELKVAGAADPADASPSLVAVLGDSRLKMMGYTGSLVFTADGRDLLSAGNHEIAFWDPVRSRENNGGMILPGLVDYAMQRACRDKPVVEWIRKKYPDLSGSLGRAGASYLGSRSTVPWLGWCRGGSRGNRYCGIDNSSRSQGTRSGIFSSRRLRASNRRRTSRLWIKDACRW